MFVSDAWPAPATYHRSFVYTVTRGCVGAPNERAPFRFHGAVVGFVARCLSRIRNLAASNKHLAEFFSGRSWPKIGPGIIFFGVFEKFETFFSKICAHSERYRNLLAGIFEIPTFSGNIAFPSSPVPHIFRTINSLLYEIRSLCPATSALPHANVEREAQATRSSAKRDQLRTLLGPLRPTGGIVSKRCCISVVVQQYAQVPDRWIVMRLVQA